MTYTFAEPTQLWLTLSASLKADAWQHVQAVSVLGSRWQAYLNQLCLRAVMSWLQDEELPIDAIWPLLEAAPSCWTLVTGTSVTVGGVKLVLIPTDTLGHDELQVPQEWVDIPSWAADYYVAVKVNVEEGWSELWGYTTHNKLKNSHYNSGNRTFSLDANQLSRNINVLWTAIEYCPEADTRGALQPQPELTSAQAESLVQRLTQGSVGFPRLSVPFSQWGALLADNRWRSQLYRKRLATLQNRPPEAAALTRLSSWLQGLQQDIMELGQLVERSLWRDAQVALRSQRKEATQTVTKTKTLLLGELPTDPQVRLMVACREEEQETNDEGSDRLSSYLNIRVELHPDTNARQLPENITLALISQEGETLQSVQSRSDDSYIRLKQFKAPVGYEFSLSILTGGYQHIEPFES